jgi:hypothetical protein
MFRKDPYCSASLRPASISSVMLSIFRNGFRIKGIHAKCFSPSENHGHTAGRFPNASTLRFLTQMRHLTGPIVPFWCTGTNSILYQYHSERFQSPWLQWWLPLVSFAPPGRCRSAPSGHRTAPTRNYLKMMNHTSDKALESWIWDAACSIREHRKRKVQGFHTPLIFTKRPVRRLRRRAEPHRLARWARAQTRFKLVEKDHSSSASTCR